MTPVYLVGRSERSILGLPLWRYQQIAVRRAGLSIVERLPEHGSVIAVDPDAVVTPEALTSLARSASMRDFRAFDSTPDFEGEVVADSASMITLADVEIVRGISSVAEAMIGRRPRRIALPVAPYRGRADRRRAEELLLRAACKPLLAGDFFGVFNREVTLPLVRPVARTGISPNGVTLIGFAFTIAAAIPLAIGGYRMFLLGAFLQWIGSLLDGIDGKLARLKGQATAFGSKLDSRLDMVFYAVLFGALGVGLTRSFALPVVALLGVSLMTGLAIAFAIGARMRRQLVPVEHPERLGPLVFETIDRHGDEPVIAFARATIRLTSRAGLPHIFLAAALVALLPAVFVATAFGIHVVWPIALRIEQLAHADRQILAAERFHAELARAERQAIERRVGHAA